MRLLALTVISLILQIMLVDTSLLFNKLLSEYYMSESSHRVRPRPVISTELDRVEQFSLVGTTRTVTKGFLNPSLREMLDESGLDPARVESYIIGSSTIPNYYWKHTDELDVSSSAVIAFKRWTSDYEYRKSRPKGEEGFIPTALLTYGSFRASPVPITVTSETRTRLSGFGGGVKDTAGVIHPVCFHDSVVETQRYVGLDYSLFYAEIPQQELIDLLVDEEGAVKNDYLYDLLNQSYSVPLPESSYVDRYGSHTVTQPHYLAFGPGFRGSLPKVTAVEPDPELAEHIRALARSKAVKKLASGELHVGIFLAEGKDTTKFLMTQLERLYRFIKSVIRLDFKGAIQALRINSRRNKGKAANMSSWDDFILEFNYGLTPLLADIEGAVKLYYESLKDKNLVHCTAMTFTDEGLMKMFPGKADEFVTSILPSLKATPHYMTKHKTTWRITNTQDRTLQELGLSNIAEVIWEKVPFSFLVDWIINIDSIIYQINAQVGLEFMHGYTTDYELLPVFIDSSIGMSGMESHARSLFSEFSPWHDLPLHLSEVNNLMMVNKDGFAPAHIERIEFPLKPLVKGLEGIFERPVLWYYNTYREPFLENPFDEPIELMAKNIVFTAKSRVAGITAFLSKILKGLR